jgi:hypothetical protein
MTTWLLITYGALSLGSALLVGKLINATQGQEEDYSDIVSEEADVSILVSETP